MTPAASDVFSLHHKRICCCFWGPNVNGMFVRHFFLLFLLLFECLILFLLLWVLMHSPFASAFLSPPFASLRLSISLPSRPTVLSIDRSSPSSSFECMCATGLLFSSCTLPFLIPFRLHAIPSPPWRQDC